MPAFFLVSQFSLPISLQIKNYGGGGGGGGEIEQAKHTLSRNKYMQMVSNKIKFSINLISNKAPPIKQLIFKGLQRKQ